MVRIWLALVLVLLAGGVRADLQSLFPSAEDSTNAVTRASLFTSSNNIGFFAPLPDRDPPQPDTTAATNASARTTPFNDLRAGTEPIDQLLSLIARAEAGSMGYDAVQYGATVRPSRLPTQMTLGDIYQWIDETPGQPHAIGRYQFIPSTLRRVARVRGFGPETKFSPAVQDALASVLLDDAGLARFQTGELGRRRFMYNLARIWAGLPLPNGQSYYDGYAGNKATMSWVTFEGGMARIWPENG